MSELANEILVHLSGCKHLELEPKDCSFCIHKLYTKFRFSMNSASAFHNQCCLILHACKVENDDTPVACRFLEGFDYFLGFYGTIKL